MAVTLPKCSLGSAGDSHAGEDLVSSKKILSGRNRPPRKTRFMGNCGGDQRDVSKKGAIANAPERRPPMLNESNSLSAAAMQCKFS